MLIALLLAAQVAGVDTLATCRAPNDPDERSWSLVRRDGVLIVQYRARGLDRPQVEMRLPGVMPVVVAGETRVSFKSFNGGRSIDWRISGGGSALDLYVNHGLEVNVEPDLDPAVDLMNTEGAVACEPPHPLTASPPPTEWTAALGIARSVNLFQSTAGRSYAVQTIGWARELTQEWGPGPLRGRFAWGVEAMPIFAQFSPSAIYGLGVAPIVWRWNFVPRPSWSAFAELAMGGMWSSRSIPEDTSRGNFTAHWGGGLRLRPRGPHAVVLAYRFQHFSNGNQLGSNPGVNAHVVLVGWSYRS